ncbi:MAG: hypothetical protein H6585_12695 [Flavobacteriales bacterium]|nr:hypothetical protein [Flavobacteriales bacterium]MCB9449189.1 hypothetical protein [Flavobacteriales bacterium]
MKKQLFSFALLCAGFGTLLFSACGSGDTSEEQDDNMDTSIVEQAADASEAYNVVLPSPLQIARIFQQAGLTYQADLVNKIENSGLYATQTGKTLNFGVYSSDLAYLVLNNQNQEALVYLKSLKDMAGNIGLSPIFNDEKLVNTFEKNMGNPDSLISVLAEIQEKLDMILQDNEQEHLHAVIFAGAWVEGMYMGSKVSVQGSQDGVNNKLMEQMNILESLITGLQQQPDKNDEINSLIGQLQDVHKFYEELNARAGEQTPTLTAEKKKELSDRISLIRNGIVKVN